ncbi:hypothetical protein LCGC14_2162180 [marine sediment metagenome]|uniref:Uncharacterized protein n=1 Tax=marine sediment metagenome TaxID=412755 RepID=A0A0F9DSJ9_9ZZZZ
MESNKTTHADYEYDLNSKYGQLKRQHKKITAQLQQQRERVEKLETALNTIWIDPMTIKLAQEIAGNALAVDDCLVKAALKELEATDA